MKRITKDTKNNNKSIKCFTRGQECPVCKKAYLTAQPYFKHLKKAHGIFDTSDSDTPALKEADFVETTKKLKEIGVEVDRSDAVSEAVANVFHPGDYVYNYADRIYQQVLRVTPKEILFADGTSISYRELDISFIDKFQWARKVPYDAANFNFFVKGEVVNFMPTGVLRCAILSKFIPAEASVEPYIFVMNEQGFVIKLTAKELMEGDWQSGGKSCYTFERFSATGNWE